MTALKFPSESPVFIIGYMACGKTTFGRAIARATGREFIDMDFRIEQRFHSTIREIFYKRGEEEFRRIEADTLREIGEMENVIISCGGGTPCYHSNMDFMLEHGNVIFLDATVERIVERLIRNRARRPLLADKTPDELQLAVETGLKERLPVYRRANIIFNGDNLEDRRQISDSIEKFMLVHPIF